MNGNVGKSSIWATEAAEKKRSRLLGKGEISPLAVPIFSHKKGKKDEYSNPIRKRNQRRMGSCFLELLERDIRSLACPKTGAEGDRADRRLHPGGGEGITVS